MALLFLSFLILFLLALLILAISFFKKNTIKRSHFIFSALFMLLFTSLVYLKVGNLPGYHTWLTQGKAHYALAVQVKKLGGIDGMITTIQHKLDQNPDDAEGWFILGKLYLAKQNLSAAKLAFKRATELAPDEKRYKKAFSSSSR